LPRHCGELRCVADSDLRFYPLRPNQPQVLCRRQSAPATPLPMTERDDQNPQFANRCRPGDHPGVFATDLYAKAYGYVSQINNDMATM